MAVLTSYWLYDVLALLAIASTALYAYYQYKFKFWKKLGIPVPDEPSFPFGNFPGVGFTKSMIPDTMKLYNKAKGEKLFGTYVFCQPLLFIRDPDLAKDILVKNFTNFHDRGIEISTKYDPLAQHLFLMKGQEWRNLRIKLTPTFTTGKIKMMFSTLFGVGNELVEVLNQESRNPEVEMRDILARYTTDVISSVAFGLEANSLKNPDCEFRQVAKSLLNPGLKEIILSAIVAIFPMIQKYVPVRLVKKQVTDFFISTFKEVMEYRQSNNIEKKDFFQLLLQLKALGYVPDADHSQSEGNKENLKEFTLELMVAQAFIFFVAGFETTSTSVLYAMYELALHPDIQKRTQTEIDKVLDKHGGEVTYEAVMEMEYLDRVVSETLRKYPVATFLIRECNSDYKVPDTDITIPKKTQLFIPLHAVHHDEEVYPNHERFDPERFLPEEKEKRNPYTYLPFGEGPRSCIANRFALMQVKAGLIILLSNFNLEPSARTPLQLKFDPKTHSQIPTEGIFFKISKRE